MKRVWLFILLALVLLLVMPARLHSPESEKAWEIPDSLKTSDPISKYDSIIRAQAREIGWDWRLLAAVIYTESRFHNEAQSHKGAVGLMQIRSERHPTESLLDPAYNLSTGAAYLGRLEKMYEGKAANRAECVKFALASYNLGETKVRELVRKASRQGLDTGRWSQVSSLLPKGHHTVAYVDKVLATYARYRDEYPV